MLSISFISVIAFSGLLITTLILDVDFIRKSALSHYYFFILVWQIANLGVYFSSNPETALIFYRFSITAATGVLISYLPLCLSLIKYQKTRLIILLAFMIFFLYLALFIFSNFFDDVYLGDNNFFVQNISRSKSFLLLPASLIFIAGIVISIFNLFRQTAVVVKQRLLYFIIAGSLGYLGIVSNLTFFKETPLDVILILFSGIMLAYAVLTKRLLDVRRTFFRGAFTAIVITSITVFFIFQLFLISLFFNRPIAYETVIPAIFSFLLIFFFINKNRVLGKRSFLFNSLFSNISPYQYNLEIYSTSIRKAYEFSEIFEAFYSVVADDFSVCRMAVYMLDSTTGDLKLIYRNEDCPEKDIKKNIDKKMLLQNCLKEAEILFLNEMQEDNHEILDCFPGKNKPDIILPLKVNAELVGIVVFKFGSKGKFYLDQEGYEYMLKLGRYTEDAIVRAYAFEQLTQDVFSKGNLIKDINHRVKNNLQMITGLLAMQEHTINNREAVSVLRTARNRIETIAKVHEMMYIGGVATTINIRDYILKIIAGFDGCNAGETDIDFRIEVPELKMETEKALTFCMIINELVANSVKYAFAGRSRGTVSIMVYGEDESLSCVIKDDGIGCSGAEEGAPEQKGLGHKLVKSFVEKQLKGSWQIVTDNGTTHKILIPV